MSGPDRSATLPRYVSRYAIHQHDERGEERFVVWWHNWLCGSHRGGTFRTIEDARKSLRSLTLAKRRYVLDAVEEYSP